MEKKIIYQKEVLLLNIVASHSCTKSNSYHQIKTKKMDASGEQIKEEFKRQVRLCGGIGKAAMLSIITEKFPPDSSDGVEIELDRTTLPKDGQAVSFQTQNEEWHDGYFVDGDDLFWINEDKWFPAFDILKWKSNV